VFDIEDDSGDGSGPEHFDSDDDDEPATKTFVEDDSEYEDDPPATKSFSTDPDEVNSAVESNSDGNVEVV
jgi:hypothetical protein